jgi:hypothetical protein
VFDGPINSIHEAPVIGNGDLAAMVQVFQDEVRLQLGKADIFDARFDYVTADRTFPQADLIRASRDHGFRLGGAAYAGIPEWDSQPDDLVYPDDCGEAWHDRVPPCPKPAGHIRILVSGYSNTAIRTEVDIATGIVRVEYAFDYGWHGRGGLAIEAFVDRNTNAVHLKLERLGPMANVWVCVEKPPDARDASLPAPEVQVDGASCGAVCQRIPEAFESGEFTWHLAGAFAAPGADAKPVAADAFRLRQVCAPAADTPLAFCVGVATTRDAEDAATHARALADVAGLTRYARVRAAHSASWQQFWAASGVALADAELEASWYRNLFALACHISPTAQAPGLCANVPVSETSPWHGVYTVNMNIQKIFLGATMTNHPEWIDCYAGWLEQMEPSFRHLARAIFDIDGIYSSHMLLPFVPPHRQFNSNTCGRALGMTGWHGQPLWWRWQTFREQDFLAEVAYPYFAKAADFYADYFDRFMDASGDIWPSLNLESPQWTRDCRHNRDCVIDLITIRKAFVYAIEAAQELDVDPQQVSRWESALARVRNVRFEELPNGGWWLWADKHDTPPTDDEWWLRDKFRHQQTMPFLAAWSIFPGEAVDGDETDGLAAAVRDIMTRCDWQSNHPAMVWIHHWWCALPALRLGLPDAFEKARELILKERWPSGHARTTHYMDMLPDTWRAPEDNYLGVAATTEMLLQSQGGILRFFPAWPPAQPASFRSLPARGGFIVDASWDPADGLSARIHSLAGQRCCLRWTALTSPVITTRGEPVCADAEPDSRTLSFATAAGETYTLASPTHPTNVINAG